MAVMATPSINTSPFQSKAQTAPSGEAMAIDTDINGSSNSYDAFLEGTAPQSSEDPTRSTTVNSAAHSLNSVEPAINGTSSDTDNATQNMTEPITNVASGIAPTAPFVPEHTEQPEPPLSMPESADTTTLPGPVEQPTSDIRDDPASIPQDTFQEPPDTMTNGMITDVPELGPATQADVGLNVPGSVPLEDPMDISPVQQTAPSLDAIDSTPAIETSNMPPPELPRDPPPTPAPTSLSATASLNAPESDLAIKPESPNTMDQDFIEPSQLSRVREREDDEMEDGPSTKRARTEDGADAGTETNIPESATGDAPGAGNGGGEEPTPELSYNIDSRPLTRQQHKILMERIRSAKKIKDGKWFTSPVDPVAMGLPTYFEIIKQPMDLSAMENKLKLNEYGSVNDFVRDFDLMVNNAVKFNGPAHVVSAASLSLRQYFFQPQVQALTRREEPQDAKKPKKPTLATSSKPARRESRSGAAPPKSAGAGSASSPTTFPLHPDGVPLIRRDSAANDRPKREIHRPPPRDLPYSHRPKKKKFSLELKFCETVQDEILKNKYKTIAWPFYDPVDPVALNIPTYHKVIKKPMDLSTISKNLKEGHYENAKSYYNDVKLMFDNCYKFNPETDEVNRVGKLFQKTFEEIWAGKQTWMDEHAPQSDPQSPASAAASDSEQEEEEDEIDPETEAQQRLIAIQQQIAALSGEANQIITQTLPGAKRASPKVGSKKNKGAKPNTKSKRSSNVGLPSSKASTKPKKKLPPITFAQKQEISDAIASLGDVEMGKAVQIIRNGVPSLKDVNDDEMELDIETIPDSVLHELLKFTRQHKPPKEDIPQDDEYEPPRAKTATSRPKKNKPMSKYEQEAAINNIQAQLGKFQHGVSGSISPTNGNDAESSDDDESSASESEEE